LLVISTEYYMSAALSYGKPLHPSWPSLSVLVSFILSFLPFLLPNFVNSSSFVVVFPFPSFLTLRRLMSYIYGAPILDVSRSHTTTQHSR